MYFGSLSFLPTFASFLAPSFCLSLSLSLFASSSLFLFSFSRSGFDPFSLPVAAIRPSPDALFGNAFVSSYGECAAVVAINGIVWNAKTSVRSVKERRSLEQRNIGRVSSELEIRADRRTAIRAASRWSERIPCSGVREEERQRKRARGEQAEDRN